MLNHEALQIWYAIIRFLAQWPLQNTLWITINNRGRYGHFSAIILHTEKTKINGKHNIHVPRLNKNKVQIAPCNLIEVRYWADYTRKPVVDSRKRNCQIWIQNWQPLDSQPSPIACLNELTLMICRYTYIRTDGLISRRYGTRVCYVICSRVECSISVSFAKVRCWGD